MLQSLHVHNFALLEDAHADFTPGFNVFTGETGAGKSILIDAFGMVLGGRSSADYVRSGTDGLWVQAVFDVSGQQEIKALLAEHGLEPEEDLFLKRQISAAGKSRAFINGVQGYRCAFSGYSWPTQEPGLAEAGCAAASD